MAGGSLLLLCGPRQLGTDFGVVLAEDGRREDGRLADAVEAERRADGPDGTLDGMQRVDHHPQVTEIKEFAGEHNGHRGLGWGRGGPSAVHLWDTATGRRLRRLDYYTQGEPFLAFSSDGKALMLFGYQVLNVCQHRGILVD